MRKFLKSIFGMFLGNDGVLSSTKLFAIVGYILFLGVSVYIAIHNPEKFNYEIFAILTAASSTTMRMIDKWLNIKSFSGVASALADKNEELERGDEWN